MTKHLYLSLIICLLISCKTDTKKDAVSTVELNEIVSEKFTDLTPLPNEVMRQLFEEASYIDYIFYNLPFSISQDDKPSIHSNLKLISEQKFGPISNSCKPIGREFFHIKGAIAYEAEIYFQDGCYGYVFLDKERPIYANKVSEEGMTFYSKIINQAQQIQNQTINGG